MINDKLKKENRLRKKERKKAEKKKRKKERKKEKCFRNCNCLQGWYGISSIVVHLKHLTSCNIRVSHFKFVINI